MAVQEEEIIKQMMETNPDIDYMGPKDVDYTGAKSKEYTEEYTDRPQDAGNIDEVQDMLGLLGIAAEPADWINAGIYGMRGDMKNMGLSAIGIGALGKTGLSKAQFKEKFGIPKWEMWTDPHIDPQRWSDGAASVIKTLRGLGFEKVEDAIKSIKQSGKDTFQGYINWFTEKATKPAEMTTEQFNNWQNKWRIVSDTYHVMGGKAANEAAERYLKDGTPSPMEVIRQRDIRKMQDKINLDPIEDAKSRFVPPPDAIKKGREMDVLKEEYIPPPDAIKQGREMAVKIEPEMATPSRSYINPDGSIKHYDDMTTLERKQRLEDLLEKLKESESGAENVGMLNRVVKQKYRK